MLQVPLGRFHGMVIVGLFFVMLLMVGTHTSIDCPSITEIECGNGTEYPGYQSWEDRQPFMHIFNGPEDVPGFGLDSSNLGDVDGDGCDDFVSMDYWAHEERVWGYSDAILLPGRTDGAFDEGQFVNLGLDTLSYACGDVNGDGFSDILSLHENTRRPDYSPKHNVTFEIRFGGVSGVKQGEDQYIIIEPFTEGSKEYYWDSFPVLNPIGDVNGDGFDDVLIIGLGRIDHNAQADFQVLHGSTEGLEGKAGTTHALPLDSPNDYQLWNWTKQVISADINGDGFSDVIIRHGAPYLWHDTKKPDSITVHLGSSEGFSPVPDLEFEQARSDHYSYAIAPVNLNGDRYDDVAIVETSISSNTENNEIHVSFHTGTSEGLSKTVASNRSFESDNPLLRPHLGFSDMDGDGFDDILIMNNYIVNRSSDHEFYPNYYDRHLSLLRNEGGTFGQRPWWSTVVPGSTGDHIKVHPGDYDGDGQEDRHFLSGHGVGSVR